VLVLSCGSGGRLDSPVAVLVDVWEDVWGVEVVLVVNGGGFSVFVVFVFSGVLVSLLLLVFASLLLVSCFVVGAAVGVGSGFWGAAVVV